MNIAIVDDSKTDRRQLISFLEQYKTENSIIINVSSYSSGEEFLEKADPSKLDAVFLDIYMDKVNGIEAAKKIRQTDASCHLVFITSSEDFAVESYTVRAFNYLVKPVCYLKFTETMKLLEANTQALARYITIKTGRELKKILLSEIIYIDYYNHYIQIHTATNLIKTYKKFMDFEQEMKNNKQFLTCYRCIMINMEQVEKVENGFFFMTNGESIPINRRNSKEIKSQYRDYIFKKMGD